MRRQATEYGSGRLGESALAVWVALRSSGRQRHALFKDTLNGCFHVP
jgi:hypothetical protein